MQNLNLVSLQTKYSDDFEQNLEYLVSLIQTQKKGSIILAPELALSGYSYEDMDKAVEITDKAIPLLKELSEDRTIALTMMTKEDNKYLNTFFLFCDGTIKYTQSKVKLFDPNDEDKYFKAANFDDIKIFDLNGIKVAVLICFELRFIEHWEKAKGADLILIPAMWGANRKDNFETLSNALAILNQCYVLVSCSANKEFCKGSGIISPFGKITRDDTKEVITSLLNKDEIKNMRKHLKTGVDKGE